MKGEYGEEQDQHHHHNNQHQPMFTKLHHHPSHHKYHQNIQPVHLAATSAAAHHHHHHLQLSQASEDSGSPTPTTQENNHLQLTTTTTTTNDGVSIEVIRRPRGRPPGSKNKPKPPVIITREPDPSMSPYVLEISPNVDIVETLNRFCRKRSTGICILTGSGTVCNVTLRQPTTTPPATVTFHGRFDILSLSATLLNATAPFANSFAISLAGPQGQIVGGAVVGPLVTAGTVYVIAATFNNPVYQKLPLEERAEEHERREVSPQAVSGGGGESGGVPEYGGGVYGSDVIWAPTPRQGPPPPPPPPY